LEKAIDPAKYILGPGDKIGLNIITTESMTHLLNVTPTGDLMIPSVGIIPMAGQTVERAAINVQNFVNKYAFPNAKVNVALVELRTFLIQITGAVNNPGFVEVTPVNRLTDAIETAGGFHKFADEKSQIIHRDNKKSNVSLNTFRITGDISQNPLLSEGDVIEIPFVKRFSPEISDVLTTLTTPVTVNGYVKQPGGYEYFSAYTVQDYIGLAGGTLKTANNKKFLIIRKGEIKEVGGNTYVLPGDQVYVKENLKSKFFGDNSILQITSGLLTIYLTYLATQN
jgi:polysaccharide export outer membrane protein